MKSRHKKSPLQKWAFTARAAWALTIASRLLLLRDTRSPQHLMPSASLEEPRAFGTSPPGAGLSIS
jgi:hypothetical protein